MRSARRVLGWTLSLGGAGIGFWYLKESTRRHNLPGSSSRPSERLRTLNGFDEDESDQELPWWRTFQPTLIFKVFGKTEERPRSSTTMDLEPDPSLVEQMEALGPLELIEDVFPGPFGDDFEIFEPDAPPEDEIDDDVPEGALGDFLGGAAENVAEAAGQDLPGVADQDAVENVAGAQVGDLAGNIAEAEVGNVVGAVDVDSRAGGSCGLNENRVPGDEPTTSGNDGEPGVGRPESSQSGQSSASRKHRDGEAEQSDDEHSSGSR